MNEYTIKGKQKNNYVDVCDNCACSDPKWVWRNSSGEQQCDSGGYSETD